MLAEGNLCNCLRENSLAFERCLKDFLILVSEVQIDMLYSYLSKITLRRRLCCHWSRVSDLWQRLEMGCYHISPCRGSEWQVSGRPAAAALPAAWSSQPRTARRRMIGCALSGAVRTTRRHWLSRYWLSRDATRDAIL